MKNEVLVLSHLHDGHVWVLCPNNFQRLSQVLEHNASLAAAKGEPLRTEVLQALLVASPQRDL